MTHPILMVALQMPPRPGEGSRKWNVLHSHSLAQAPFFQICLVCVCQDASGQRRSEHKDAVPNASKSSAMVKACESGQHFLQGGFWPVARECAQEKTHSAWRQEISFPQYFQ